jgi:hypothetical protein
MENQIDSSKKLPCELEKPASAAKATGKIEAVLEASPRDRDAATVMIKSAYSQAKGDSVCT